MRAEQAPADPLAEWLRIPERLRRCVRGASRAELDASDGEDDVSAREYVHHLVEANVVASTMMIAALGGDGCAFDWSWLWPNRAWMRRAGYDRAEIEPALAALRALSRFVAGLVRAQPDALQRKVRLRDAPEKDPYDMTIEQILRMEVEHARTHVDELRAARRKRRR